MEHLIPALSHIDATFMPLPNTAAFKVLEILSDGKSHPKIDFLTALADDPRSAIQRLRNKSHGYWLIHNVGLKKGVYRLDAAHLYCDSNRDIHIRRKAQYELKRRSKEQAKTEAARLPVATALEQSAKAQLQDSESQHEFCYKSTSRRSFL
jgi:hypothetical protein